MTAFHWYISLQHDWRDILRSPDQRSWITCTKTGEKNLYGEVFKPSCASKGIKATEGVQASYFNEENIQLKFDGTTSYFYSPTKSFKDIHYKAINSLNISTGGSLGVSSSNDGNLFIWQTEDGKIRRTLEGHVIDVTHCRFFPSGMVILSGGSDMMLKIWSVEDGSCPVTLIGHTGAITDTCIINRGRNFISCGRDGYVKLWDCGTAKCLLNLCEGGSVINRCLLSTHTWNSVNHIVDRSEHESGTEGKLLIIAKEAGSLEALDVFSREKVIFIIDIVLLVLAHERELLCHHIPFFELNFCTFFVVFIFYILCQRFSK